MDKKGKSQDVNIYTVPNASASAAPPSQVSIWGAFAPQHLHSACYLARMAAKQFEKRYANSSAQPSQEEKYQHQAYVIGSIFASVGFLEATINEVFLEADNVYTQGVPASMLKQLPSSTIATMAQIWHYKVRKIKKSQTDIQGLDKHGKRSTTYTGLVNYLLNKKLKNGCVQYWPTLDKFQCALYLADAQHELPFDQNDVLWKDAKLLIRLRNHLTHHKSQSVTYSPSGSYEAERKDTKELAKELNTRKFNNCELNNPLTKGVRSGNILEPVLGATCAMWGVNSSVQLALHFSRRSHIELWGQGSIPNIKKQLSSVAVCD